MRLGVCAPIEKAAVLARAGADYIELACAAMLIPDADDADWEPLRLQIAASPLPAEVFNVLITSGKIVGPEADAGRLHRYVDTAARRAALCGAEYIVLGSGGARRVDPGVDEDAAMLQFKQFLGSCEEAGTRHGVTYVIEPLNRAETNFVNSVASGAELVRAVNTPHIKLLADSYHMDEEDEPNEVLVRTNGLIKHAHTADTRRVPPGQGHFDHTAFMRTLRIAGYRGRLSIECRWGDFDAEVGPALAHLRAIKL